MASNTIARASALVPTTASGPLMGLGNMLGKENARWWKTRLWIAQILIWLVTIDFFVAAPLFMGGGGLPSDPASRQTNALTMLFLLGGLFTGFGAIILMQGAIIGERQSGTAAWVLSKPLARPAFVLSKLFANTFGMLVTAVLVPGVVGYVLCTVAGGPSIGMPEFAVGLGLWLLHILFYICLALMLGTIFESRGAVGGIGIAVLLAPQFLKDVVPQLTLATPMWLVMPVVSGGEATSLAVASVSGQPLPATLPILLTVGWCLLFLAVALWRFSRQEF